MTFGYDSSYVFGNSSMGINDFAVDLLTRLHLERRDSRETSRPLIFICHSLGGIVLKEAIIHSSLQAKDYPGILDSIAGVVFMGTPHRGSRSATQAQHLANIINIVTLGSGVRKELLKTLETSSRELETISRHATQLLKNFPIISFYERKPLIGSSLVSHPIECNDNSTSIYGRVLIHLNDTKIVEPFSAILELPNERAIPINADHRQIAKVSPRHEQRYKPVWATIQQLIEGTGRLSKIGPFLIAVLTGL